MPGWYVSYAWGDDRTPEGCARDEIVEKLCSAGNEKGIVIQRDKNVLSFGESISAFMRQIGAGDRIFVILSDKYLRSPYCMFELSEIWRANRQEGLEFLDRVRVYIVDEVKIHTPEDWADWAIFWKKQHDTLDQRARQHGASILGEYGYRRLQQMQRFYTQVADILGILADIVQPRSFEELQNYGLADTADAAGEVASFQVNPTHPSKRQRLNEIQSATAAKTGDGPTPPKPAQPQKKWTRGTNIGRIWLLGTMIRLRISAQGHCPPHVICRDSQLRWTIRIGFSFMNSNVAVLLTETSRGSPPPRKLIEELVKTVRANLSECRRVWWRYREFYARRLPGGSCCLDRQVMGTGQILGAIYDPAADFTMLTVR